MTSLGMIQDFKTKRAAERMGSKFYTLGKVGVERYGSIYYLGMVGGHSKGNGEVTHALSITDNSSRALCSSGAFGSHRTTEPEYGTPTCERCLKMLAKK